MATTIFSKIEGGLWGCIVVFSAFFIQVLAFGTAQSIGVYNVEFLRHFDAGAAEVSLVGSINLGVFLGAGPLSSILMARWSHRQVALVGAVLTNIGLIFMPFAPNLPYMYAFYGVITGLGNSLVYVPSHILSGLYFSKHRSLSTGIATAGSGMGATLFPIVIYHLIQYYGWQGSLFIVAGLNLHLFVLAALLRPVPKHLSELLALKEIQRENNNPERSSNGSITDRRSSNGNITDRRSSNGNITDRKNSSKEFNEVLLKQDEDSEDKRCVQIVDETECAMIVTDNTHSTSSHTTSVVTSKTNRKFGILEGLKEHFKSIMTLDFTLYWFSNICWNAGGGIIMIFLPEYMITVGLDKESASVVLTFLGAGSCIGCVIGGLLGNIKYFDRVVLYIFGNLIAGLVTLLLPWTFFHSFIGQSFISFVFGFAFGIILGLLVVVTSDLLGTEGLSHGFGYLMFANGIGIFGGPPIAGVMMDSMGESAPAMYLSGVLTIMGGLVMCIVPITHKLCGGGRPTGIQLKKEIILTDN